MSFKQKLKSIHYDLSLSLFFLFRRKLRITCRIRDGLRAGYSGGSYGLGDRGNCTNMRSGDSCFLQLLDYRCTATRTGSSRRGQDGCLNTGFTQVFCHFLTEFGSVRNGRGISCCGEKERI